MEGHSHSSCNLNHIQNIASDMNCCTLCGIDSCYNYTRNHYGQTVKHWLRWKSDCISTLSQLFTSSNFEERIQQLVEYGGDYCINCSSLVWDIHFTVTQIKRLKHRLRNLKSKVIEKLEFHSRRLPDPRKADLIEIGTGSEIIDSNDLQIRYESKVDLDDATHTDTDCFGVKNLDGPQIDPVVQIKGEPVDPDSCPELDLTLLQDELETMPDLSNEEVVELKTKRKGSRTAVEKIDNVNVNGHVVYQKKKRGRPAGRRGRYRKWSGLVKSEGRNAQESILQRDKEKASDDDDPDFVLPDLRHFGLQRKCKRKKPKPCSVCSVVCQTKKGMTAHMELKHPNYLFECPVCHKHYKREQQLEFHVMNIHGGIFPFYCSTCHQGFQTQEDVTKHEEVHNCENPFVCTICQKLFTNLSDLESHVPTHSHTFKCTHPGCEKTFGTKHSFNRHVAYHNRNLVCDTCGSAFRFRSSFATHLKTHTSEGRHECHICHRAYKTADYLKHHMKLHLNPEEARRFPCRVCSKPFQTDAHRKRHEETHGGAQTYMCPTCGKRFSTKAGLNSHEYVVHEDDPVRREIKRAQKQGQWKRYYEKRKLASKPSKPTTKSSEDICK